jgi:hypothetical protein
MYLYSEDDWELVNYNYVDDGFGNLLWVEDGGVFEFNLYNFCSKEEL